MLAIIPARGGSKGLPGKNIRSLNGRPLIAYTISAAMQSEHITNVLVSTDDSTIAEIAKEEGAWVPFLRPSYLASDSSRSIDVYRFTISKLEDEYHKHFNSIVILQPTSPMRTTSDIDEAITMFKDKKADSVISLTKENHPIAWHKTIKLNGEIEKINESSDIKNRQEYQSTYYPNGSIYVFDKEFLMENDDYYGGKSFAYIMPKLKSIDIDDLNDFNYAEFLLKNKKC